MERIDFSSVGVTAGIKTTKEKIEQILSDPFSFHYIPNFRKISSKGEILVEEVPHMEGLCSLEYPNARLNPRADERSFIVVAEYLMERMRQDQKGIYSISSSSVYKENKGILFFGGETNLGKSSCALGLSESGFTLFSDEKTLLDLERRAIVGGSRGIPLRKEVIKKRFKENGAGFQEIKYDDSINPEAKLLILPHLDHGLKSPIISEFESLDLFWLLTKEFSRRIRGNTKFINYFEYLLPSIETEELAQKRIELTKKFSRNTEGYYFQGDLNQLKKFVNQNI